MVSRFRELEKKMGLPPLTEMLGLVSGENGKRMNIMLGRLEKLAGNMDSLREAIQLLRLVQELGREGYLKQLDSILEHIPKGKGGEVMISELRQIIVIFSEKIDKLSKVASQLLSKDE